MAKKKKFKLVDAILATVCITLVAESVAPTAAIGNSQYFWWIFLIIAFCIPYGMISAELGTTYQSEGGMYDWVKRAFGPKWASRVAWNYWINFPLWIASLAVAVTDVVAGIFEIELSLGWLLVLQLGYTWLVSFLGTQRIGESKWIVNLGTFFKIAFMVGLGLLGIYVYIKTGKIIYSISLHAIINIFGSIISTIFAQSLKKISAFNPIDITVVAVYMIILFSALIIGLYAIMNNYNKIDLNEIYLEKPAKTVFLNVGMILFILFETIIILKSLNIITFL